jgi:predicted  nucleic acid-binding Zn-ribbon protein
MSDHIPDPTKMISDTPRTDAAYFKDDATMYDLTGEMKRIERELNAANERIKRLEEAGDALCENSNPSRWDSTEAAAQKLTEQSNWRKAKEAK